MPPECAMYPFFMHTDAHDRSRRITPNGVYGNLWVTMPYDRIRAETFSQITTPTAASAVLYDDTAETSSDEWHSRRMTPTAEAVRDLLMNMHDENLIQYHTDLMALVNRGGIHKVTDDDLEKIGMPEKPRQAVLRAFASVKPILIDHHLAKSGAVKSGSPRASAPGAEPARISPGG